MLRRRSRAREAETRAWSTGAETDRDVLVAGLAKRSGAGVEAYSAQSPRGSSGYNNGDALPDGDFELPRWVVYPDVEKVQWLNILLRRLWPHLKTNLASSIQDSVQPLLDSARPTFMSSLGFSALNFATTKDIGVKTYDQVGRDSINLHWPFLAHT